MAWYKDLSPIDYFGASASSQLRAIGWLEKGRDFANGKTSKEVFERLRELLADPWEPCVCPGWHECELCQFVGDKGSRNLFVPGKGVIYVSPELVVHYINVHQYMPPPEFADAVMRCPNMRSMDYKRAIVENGGRALLKQ